MTLLLTLLKNSLLDKNILTVDVNSLKITAQLLGSVTSGYDAIYSEQKKVTELLYHLLKHTPQYREAELKSSLLENGWTLNEIENTDLNELLVHLK